MRLRSLVPALAFLALAACDSTGALKIAQAPAAKPADCCCKPVTTAATCPPTAAPTPIAAQPTAMTPEPERVIHRPAAPHRAARPAVRRVAYARHGQVEREYGEVREYAYAQQQRSYAAPAYDGYVDVPDRRIQGRVVSVEEQETSSERYSEQSEAYSSGSRRYAGGYEQRGGYDERGGYDSRGEGRGCGGCAPREAAGRDRNGFLTWPGKVPARP